MVVVAQSTIEMLDRSRFVAGKSLHCGVARFGERVAAMESLCNQESFVGQSRKRRVKGLEIRAAEAEHFSRCH